MGRRFTQFQKKLIDNENFINWQFETNKNIIRLYLSIYIIIYLLFGSLDYHTTNASFLKIMGIRLTIGTPPLILALIASFIPSTKRYHRIINGMALFIMSFSLVLIFATLSPNEPAYNTNFTGMVITIAVLGISFSGRYLVGLLVTINTLAYILTSIYIHDQINTNFPLFIQSTTFIITITIYAIVLAYVLEKSALKLYLSNRQLNRETKTIRIQKNELQEANRTKDRLFSILAHDLKNPFNGLLGYFQLMNQVKINKENREILDQVQNYTQQTFNMLDHLLLWSKTQLGKTIINPQTYSTKHIIESNFAIMRELANQKKINLINNSWNNQNVKCDKDMITIVMRNLITNSIKFTPTGGEVTIETHQTTSNHIEFAITDNGIGMNHEMKDNLLNLEKCITCPGTRGESGSGLGIIICKEFLKMHNSRLTIFSEPNKGSRFSFLLPIA